jgi:hypothetical protein
VFGALKVAYFTFVVVDGCFLYDFFHGRGVVCCFWEGAEVEAARFRRCVNALCPFVCTLYR